jgi:hypothetical protein
MLLTRKKARFCKDVFILYSLHDFSIIANSYKYEIKYSFDSVQLTIDHLTSHDEGEYICLNNETNHIVKQYKLKLGTIKNVLLLFFILISSILILIPIFWYLGKKYSGINQ